MTLAFVFAVSMGMGAEIAVAQENESVNETANESEGVDDGLKRTVESIIDRTDPDNAREEYIEIVERFATAERLEELGDDERNRILEWLEEARGDDDRDDQGEQNETASSNEPTSSTNASASDAVKINDATTITSWEFVDNELIVTIDSAITQTVTISDSRAGAAVEGATRVPEQRQDLERGTNTIALTLAEQTNGYVATVSTSGGTIRLSTGLEEAEPPDPFRHFGGTSGLFSGVGITVLLALVGAYLVVREESSGVVRASP
ncbi:hypothetical protein [Halomontanus rarus]|uniref:hypothetical protein n=1 Tax=Halomontanus rarus TaxID=3034020 RepID=UPI0023E7E9A9|nr:hypothetical protein [Halovivax sp. TS33]